MDTNAIRLRDAAFATRLRDAGLVSTLVSFHSADPTLSDEMTRARGTWARTVEGIHGALSAGLFVGLNCVVERANVAHLEAHARFVRAHFVDSHRDNPVRVVNYSQPGKYYDEDLFHGRMVPIDVARPHVMAAVRVLHDAGVNLEIDGTCGFPTCVLGELAPLVPRRSNELRDGAHVTGRRRPATCDRCSARGHCVGVRREYLDRFGERGLVPFATQPISSVVET